MIGEAFSGPYKRVCMVGAWEFGRHRHMTHCHLSQTPNYGGTLYTVKKQLMADFFFFFLLRLPWGLGLKREPAQVERQTTHVGKVATEVHTLGSEVRIATP